MERKALLLTVLLAALSFRAQPQEIETAINAVLDWESMTISATITLDLAAAQIKLPAGRTRAESILLSEYIRLIRASITGLPVDSSSFIAELVESGGLAAAEVDNMALSARRVPPALSSDLSRLTAFRVIDLKNISSLLIRHTTAVEPPRTLSPVPERAYSGIIILADESLPVHGRKTRALPLPALFPKIWDSDMNLIYSRQMVSPPQKSEFAMVRYTSSEKVFRATPSGIDASLVPLIGENPLRIIPEGVFGIRPTDIIINREDALRIISSEANRALLREGRVVIVLSDTVLHQNI